MSKQKQDYDKVLELLVEYIDFEIFSIEQDAREKSVLDYSLCSSHEEKQKLTKQCIKKFKTKISKCNPAIAVYLSALTRNNPSSEDHYQTRETVIKNFLFEFYSELIDDLANDNFQESDSWKFDSLIRKKGYNIALMKQFISGIADVSHFLTYQSFLKIPKQLNLNYSDLIEKINNAFFRLELFVAGKAKDYRHFDFNTAFTELFYHTNLTKNYTPENFKRIGFYWKLADQYSNDYDKGNFENLDVLKNKDFCKDCDSLTSISWDRIEEFAAFTTPDEIDEQNKKLSITQIIVNPVKDPIKLSSETNKPYTENIPHPRIFTSVKAYKKFENLLIAFGNTRNNLANYSYVFHQMQREGLIHETCQQKEFVYLLIDLNIDIDRIKSLSQIGKIEYKSLIYNRA